MLYINNQRVLTFNTRCPQFGDFRSLLVFVGPNHDENFVGWLEDPVNDPIDAFVRAESHGGVPGTGPIVLEGFLFD